MVYFEDDHPISPELTNVKTVLNLFSLRRSQARRRR